MAFAFPSVAQTQDCVRVVGPQWAAEQQSVDPINNISVGDTLRIATIYEKLVEIDNAYQPKAVLAESWEANADGTVWTFHLRKGVKFQDGRDFGAKDVIWSLQRVLDPKLDSGGGSVLNMIDPGKIRAIDDHTVEFTLKVPIAILPTLLTTKYAAIVPAGMNHDDIQKAPVGTGPYMVKSFTPGPKFRGERNPYYWRADLPGAPCIELSGISEAVSRSAALTSGQADVLTQLEPAAAATLAAAPEVNLLKAPGGGVVNFAMWIDTPPFDDVRVRTALKLLVDRQVFVDTVLLGIGVPGNDAPVTPLSPDAYQKEIIPRDVKRAKELLAEAGYPNGLTLDLYTSEAIGVMVPAAQVYQQMAADAGVKVNVIMSPADTYWTEILLKRPFIADFWGDRPTAEALSIAYLSDSAYPETHWKRPDYDALIHKANATMDPLARRALYQEAQKMLATEGGLILPAFATTAVAVRKGCSGYVPNNNTANYDFSALTCR